MPRVRVIHWKQVDAAALVRSIEESGCTPEYGGEADGAAVTKAIQQSVPDAVVIDLSRLPSHGREIAVWLRGRKATRQIPILFVGGETDKVARMRELLPDAIYTELDELSNVLATLLDQENPPAPVVPPPMMERYGTRTAAQKLGIRAHMKVGVKDPPRDYASVLGAMPEGAEFEEDAETPHPVTLWFVHEPEEFLRAVTTMRRIADQTKLWVLWRKGSRNGITQNFIREAGIDAGLVDYKICAVDGHWSGIAFARKKAR